MAAFGAVAPDLRGNKMFDMSGGLSPELVELRKLDIMDHLKLVGSILGDATREPPNEEASEHLLGMRRYMGIPVTGVIAGEGEQVQVRIELENGPEAGESTMRMHGSQRTYSQSLPLHIQPLAIDVGQEDALVHHTHVLARRALERLRADNCTHPLSEVQSVNLSSELNRCERC